MEKLTALRIVIRNSPKLSESCKQKLPDSPYLEIDLDPEVASSSNDSDDQVCVNFLPFFNFSHTYLCV